MLYAKISRSILSPTEITKTYNLNVSKFAYENEDQIQIGGYEEWSYDFSARG